MSLRLQQVRKNYVAPDGAPAPVIDIHDLSLADGEQVALIGTSGSGKTTLLHMIAGILAADSGAILFQTPSTKSIDIARLSEPERDVFRGRHIGYIFQTHH